MRILIAEDDISTRTMLSALVRKWGFEPQAVSDGQSALEALQDSQGPRLALIDWGMPSLSGVEVCRRLRAEDAEERPYIILLTARGNKQDLVVGLDAGADDYLTKPFDTDELFARLRVGRRMIDMQAEKLEISRHLAHEALHDSLTGVMNRKAILDTLEKERARCHRTGQPLALGLMDLDHFKKVNDAHGHQAGDEVLTGFVKRIQENLRTYDHLGRYGGEEFLVLIPGVGAHEIHAAYERLRTVVAEEVFPTRVGELRITTSIGVALCGQVDTVDSLLSAADSALYRAKAQGRNAIVVCEATENPSSGK